MEEQQKKQIIEQAGFKCAKCGFYSPLGKDLHVLIGNGSKVLCSICNTFAPEQNEKLNKYIEEKINWQTLESFRRFGTNKSSHSVHKKGMIEGAKQGRLMARPPFGYKVLNGDLIPDQENKENVRLIFEEFANGKSLNQISQQYGISVNGIKKILKNFTYLGKIKFAGSIVQGNHAPLISAELFNRVQYKIEQSDKKKQKI